MKLKARSTTKKISIRTRRVIARVRAKAIVKYHKANRNKYFYAFNPRNFSGKARVLRSANLLIIATAVLFFASAPTITAVIDANKYKLNDAEKQLVGKTAPSLKKQFELDREKQAYIFNKEGMEQAAAKNPSGSPEDVAKTLKKRLGAKDADTKSKPLYSVEIPLDPSKGITFYDNNLGLSFTMVPKFKTGAAKLIDGRIIYPLENGARAVYTAKNNGFKEDILIPKNLGNKLEYGYDMQMPKELEARKLSDGSLGIYSADPALFGDITFGGDQDRLKVESARSSAKKDNLVFGIPSPVIVQSGSKDAKKSLAYFKLGAVGKELSVVAENLNELSYPLSIDPSVVVTSTSDFAGGNNEGSISFGTNEISNSGVSAGIFDGSWTGGTSFTTGRYYHSSVAYGGYMYILGGRTTGSTDLNDVQYAPINSDGTLGSWTSTNSFTGVRNGHASVAYNGYIYVIGGAGAGYYSDVQYAPINGDGTVGTWASTSSFGGARNLHSSVVYAGYMYVIGGYPTVATNDVQYAPINANGTLGTWAATTSFTNARYGHASAAYNGYIYLSGGYNGAAALNDVQYARINANGTVSSWAGTLSFTTTRFTHNFVITGGHAYITGGSNGSTYYNDVQYARINANGTLGTWTTSTSFTTARAGHASIAYKGYLYITGGYDGTNYYNGSQFAKIRQKLPGVGGATTTTAFTNARTFHSSVAYNGYLYVIGGWNNASTYYNDVQYAPINGDGTVGSWASTSSFTTARYGHTSVAYNGYMYVIGGNSSGGLLNNVQYAPINGGGELGSWSNTSSFTTARYWHASTVHNGYVYLLGGSNGDYTNNLGDVQYAPINGGGTLGAWASTTGLPTVRIGHTVITSGNYMYSISGFTNGTGYLTEVLYSLIDGSGTLGIWQYTSNVSVPGAGLRADIKDGYVYLTGGFAYYDQGYYFNDVQYAQIFTTGGVGAWALSENKLKTPRANHSSVVSGDYLYSLGGQTTGDGVLSSVEYTKIGLNNLGAAAIGNMSDTSRNINIGRHENRSVAYNGYLYSLGGKDAALNYYSDVQYATIDSGGNIGAWSYTQSFNGAGRKAFTAHAYNGYMYIVGGETSPSNFVNTVQYAPINANGALGTWQSANSLNFARGYHGGAIYNGYIYATNGTIGGSVSASIEYAAINNNGSLGVWNITSNPTTPTNTHVSLVYNGYLYTIGGWTGTVHVSGYQYAKLNTNGSVGSWAEVSNAFPARAHHGAFAYNGFMYVIGGYGAPSWNALSDAYVAKINTNGTTSAWSLAGSGVLNNQEFNITQYGNTVISVGGSANRVNTYSATVSTIDQKARYSKLMNLGGVFNFERMTSSKTGNAEIRPSFRYGGSTRLTLATDQKCKPSTQYVLFMLEIDESNSMTLDGTPSSIQDVTLEYSSKYQTNQRLRGGAWFNNESLQPLDTCAP